MKGARAALVYGQIIGFVSALFMAYVFFNEAVLHRGVLYYELNLWIATLELVMVVVGAFIAGWTIIFFVKTPSNDKETKQEPFGHGKNRGVYS